MLVTTHESFDTLPQFSALWSRLLNYEARHRAPLSSGPIALMASQTPIAPDISQSSSALEPVNNQVRHHMVTRNRYGT
ncbi:hypothetical protein FRX31_033641, partial [Thalictrum thalictroides]